MRLHNAAVVVALVVLAAPVHGQAAAGVPRLPSIALPAELERVLRDYEREWAKGDAAALSLLFTDDGFVPNSGGWIRGRQQIAAEYARASGDLRLRALAYAVDGAVGYIIGAYGYGPGATESDGGKFILALRRGPEGKWLIAADLDAGNRRPAPGGN